MISANDKPSPSPRAGSGQMFDGIAERYDLLNRVISFGVDQSWRQQTVAALDLAQAESPTVLDLATGTGDLALLVAKNYPRARVIGLDPSVRMMEVGRQKVATRGRSDAISFVEGDAQNLPFEDNTIDGLTMAFGIRNVPDRPLALREMARVLRPGGKAGILELSEPQTGMLGALGRFHMHHVVPFLGALISGEAEYRYLPQSIAAFPQPADFARLMTQSGLTVERVVPFTFSVCQLFVGVK